MKSYKNQIISRIFSLMYLIFPVYGYAKGELQASFFGPWFYDWGFWIILLICAAFAVLIFQKKEDDSEKAIELLKERYAKGEISKSEYESIKKDLEK